MPEYTFKEFCEIAVTRLRKDNVDESLARLIAEKVWNELGSRDIRDTVKVGRLSTNIQGVPFVVKMLTKRISNPN